MRKKLIREQKISKPQTEKNILANKYGSTIKLIIGTIGLLYCVLFDALPCLFDANRNLYSIAKG